jgi:hypothetical protein
MFVHHRLGVMNLLGAAASTIYRRRTWDLPVLAHEVSTRARGLRPRRVAGTLAVSRPNMLPSDQHNVVGTLIAPVSRLNTPPMCTPVNASLAALRLQPHDSGPPQLARLLASDSFILYSMPVAPKTSSGGGSIFQRTTDLHRYAKPSQTSQVVMCAAQTPMLLGRRVRATEWDAVL